MASAVTSFTTKRPNDFKIPTTLCWTAVTVGTVAVVLIALWAGHYSGGFGWDEPELQFRWHPFLTTFGMIYCQGNSIILYRTFRYVRKPYLKCIHATLHVLSSICTIVGLLTVLFSHINSRPQQPNFESIHGWLGSCVIGLYLFQTVFSILAFGFRGFPVAWRVKIVPLHRFMGIFLFVASFAVAMGGLCEKQAFDLTCWTMEGYICEEMMIMNLYGVVCFIYAGLVLGIVFQIDWARDPLASD
uniref:Cytochrome b561 domain-containing protein n=1 Tax=Rhabditophanes sp. KR3021 TaxID=114890 RepID=A0AC35U7W7_9BILA